MPRPSFMTYRITVGRRHALDALGIALRFRTDGADDVALTDAQVMDFALDWALASMPERFTPRQAAQVIRMFGRYGPITQASDYLPASASDPLDMTKLAERVKESNSSGSRRPIAHRDMVCAAIRQDGTACPEPVPCMEHGTEEALPF